MPSVRALIAKSMIYAQCGVTSYVFGIQTQEQQVLCLAKSLWHQIDNCFTETDTHALIAMFMGPTWGPSGSDRTQVGPMLAPWILLSGMLWIKLLRCHFTVLPHCRELSQRQPPVSTVKTELASWKSFNELGLASLTSLKSLDRFSGRICVVINFCRPYLLTRVCFVLPEPNVRTRFSLQCAPSALHRYYLGPLFLTEFIWTHMDPRTEFSYYRYIPIKLLDVITRSAFNAVFKAWMGNRITNNNMG